eukprot:tig00021463_g21623.t1
MLGLSPEEIQAAGQILQFCVFCSFALQTAVLAGRAWCGRKCTCHIEQLISSFSSCDCDHKEGHRGHCPGGHLARSLLDQLQQARAGPSSSSSNGGGNSTAAAVPPPGAYVVPPEQRRAPTAATQRQSDGSDGGAAPSEETTSTRHTVRWTYEEFIKACNELAPFRKHKDMQDEQGNPNAERALDETERYNALVVRSTCKQWQRVTGRKIVIITGAPYRPWHQGSVERANRTLGRRVTAYCFFNGTKDWVQWQMNTSIFTKGHKQTPFKVMFNRDPSERFGNLAPASSDRVYNEREVVQGTTLQELMKDAGITVDVGTDEDVEAAAARDSWYLDSAERHLKGGFRRGTIEGMPIAFMKEHEKYKAYVGS